MEERTSGIILRTRPLTETSLVVQWLTPDLGRILTVAKGARRPKSPFLGKLDLFYEADFSIARSRRSELHNLREVCVRRTNASLRQDIERLNQAAYFVVLLERSTEPEAPVPELYQLLGDAIAHLAEHPNTMETVLVFELKLLSALGYEPKLEALSSGARSRAQVALQSGSSFSSCVKELSALELRTKQEVNRFLFRAVGTSFERVPAQRARAVGGD